MHKRDRPKVVNNGVVQCRHMNQERAAAMKTRNAMPAVASMADAYEVNVAPHNFNGHLGSLISAHFCAVVPNFKVMEIDIDDIRWKDDIVTVPPVIENGEFLLPTGPGWGADVNEEFVRAHPPKGR